MFKTAIKKGTNYLKPLLTGKVIYQKRSIINDINTLMVLNNNGDILTCGHIAELFKNAEEVNEVFAPILKEMKDLNPRNIKKIEDKYGIKEDTVIALSNILVDVTDNFSKLDIIKHSYFDLAIIKLDNFNNKLFNEFPVFNTSDLEIGTSVCNLGFAFPEYDAFDYDEVKEKMVVTNKIMNFPLFPTHGIVTRNVIDSKNEITMFETSAEVLPGQNGGPVLNKDGEVLGMIIGNKSIKINKSPSFVHNVNLGVAVKSLVITNFLDEHKISYNKTSN